MVILSNEATVEIDFKCIPFTSSSMRSIHYFNV